MAPTSHTLQHFSSEATLRNSSCEACTDLYNRATKAMHCQYIRTQTHILYNGISLCCPDFVTPSSPVWSTRAESIMSEISDLDLNDSGNGDGDGDGDGEDPFADPVEDGFGDAAAVDDDDDGGGDDDNNNNQHDQQDDSNHDDQQSLLPSSAGRNLKVNTTACARWKSPFAKIKDFWSSAWMKKSKTTGKQGHGKMMKKGSKLSVWKEGYVEEYPSDLRCLVEGNDYERMCDVHGSKETGKCDL